MPAPVFSSQAAKGASNTQVHRAAANKGGSANRRAASRSKKKVQPVLVTPRPSPEPFMPERQHRSAKTRRIQNAPWAWSLGSKREDEEEREAEKQEEENVIHSSDEWDNQDYVCDTGEEVEEQDAVPDNVFNSLKKVFLLMLENLKNRCVEHAVPAEHVVLYKAVIDYYAEKVKAAHAVSEFPNFVEIFTSLIERKMLPSQGSTSEAGAQLVVMVTSFLADAHHPTTRSLALSSLKRLARPQFDVNTQLGEC
eukprot:GHVT01087744.1.p1 GENE.GHVT01087744.1~~GHVT01087744.1.p1  ORF type:complete len:252 (-),score=45.09 GHVT01087744.1:2575-3330(-)